MHLFDQDISLTQKEHLVFKGNISNNWSVNGTPNGGYLMAMLANAMVKCSDKKEIYLLNSYLISKGFKPYFILYDYFLLENEEVNIVNFEGEKNLKNHIENNKLRISDDIDSNNAHFSINGHKNIAELLYKNITND